MATVLKSGRGYEFAALSTIGRRLVNEFQRAHPELCVPSSEPSYRYIREGSEEQNLLIEKLVSDVQARDPVIAPPTFTWRR
jgi:hypothetical protein